MDQQKEYEEFTIVSPTWSWAFLIAFTALIMCWGMFVEMMAGEDQPRTWDFGVLPDVPSQSVYSTVAQPNDVNVPLQIKPLPEAMWDKNKGAAK